MRYIIIFLISTFLLSNCDVLKKTTPKDSIIKSIYLENYYLYEIELKNKSENYYGLVLSKNKYQNVSLKTIISPNNYFIVDNVSFNTYFDMKDDNYLIDEFNLCENKLDYEEEFITSFEDTKKVINLFKVSGKFNFRSTYSGWYDSFSTTYINLNSSKKINVIYAICDKNITD